MNAASSLPFWLLVSSRISTTDTSLPGAVLRARYGDTLMGLRIDLPLSTSVMVRYWPGHVNPSTQRCWLNNVPEDDLRWLSSASPCSSVMPTTRLRSLPFRDAALFAISSPSNDSSLPAPPLAAASQRRRREREEEEEEGEERKRDDDAPADLNLTTTRVGAVLKHVDVARDTVALG